MRLCVWEQNYWSFPVLEEVEGSSGSSFYSNSEFCHLTITPLGHALASPTWASQDDVSSRPYQHQKRNFLPMQADNVERNGWCVMHDDSLTQQLTQYRMNAQSL